jgi:predicted esterase
MSPPDLSFVHRFLPGTEATAPVLLLLHGTGGDENDLIPLGELLWPGASLLSPRGQVLEQGMPRFFRRIAPGVFDEDDLRRRAHDLADFIVQAAERYDIDRDRLVAVGYSNGANMAAATLMLHPDVFRHAVLWHAQVPLRLQLLPNITSHGVLLTGGRRDSVVPPLETENLRGLLAACGAAVRLVWFDTDHALSEADVSAARQWLHERFMSGARSQGGVAM